MSIPASYQVSPNGKLLLSAEYFVLDGALALALPTKLGQSFEVSPLNAVNRIEWKSFAQDGQCWFAGQFSLAPLAIIGASDLHIAQRLLDLLTSIQSIKPDIWTKEAAFQIETRLNFPREWGLGSSSTLVSALAKWSEIDPYQLLAKTFGGSGYDLACAQAKGPILYQRRADQPAFLEVPFLPPFKNQLYFVYLGKKQNSREGIKHYRAIGANNDQLRQQISKLTWAMAHAASLTEFESLMLEHEKLVSQTLNLPRAKTLYFQDFVGEIKSLGAWGGDFVLATSPLAPEETSRYFQKKGFNTVFQYQELIL